MKFTLNSPIGSLLREGVKKLRRFRYLLLTGITAALVLFAQVSAASACLWGFYQPEVPAELDKY